MTKPKTVAGTVADPLIRFATLTIDGEPYKLAYDFNAIATAENLTGVNLLGGFMRGFRWADLNAQEFRGLFYAALLKAHPKLTLEQAGTLVRMDTIAQIINAIQEAYLLSLPEKKEPAAETAEPLAAAS